MNPLRIFLLAALVLIVFGMDNAEAEKIDPIWSYTYGGVDYDLSHNVELTSDNGYALFGSTNSYGNGGYDYWLIKTDENGIEEWNKTYGTTNDDYGSSFQITQDGGYILAGNNHLIKTDENGIEEWNKTLEDVEDARINQNHNGTFLFTRYSGSTSTLFLLLMDSAGEEIWNNTISCSCRLGSVKETSNGSYIVVGTEHPSFSNRDLFLLKADSSGNEEWRRTINVSYNEYGAENGNDIIETENGDFIAIGSAQLGQWPNSGPQKIWAVKTNSSGEILWKKAFLKSHTRSYGHSIGQTSFDQYTIVGQSQYEENSDWDYCLVVIDEDGVEQWNSTYGNTYNNYAYDFHQNIDGTYIISGSTTTENMAADALLMKVPSGPNLRPIAEIDFIHPSPARFSDIISFNGSGNDYDGNIVSYEWESSIDGFLSDERFFNISNLTDDIHTISFRVQDDDGDWSNWVHIQLLIYPNAVPVAVIDSSISRTSEKGIPFNFSGNGFDSDGTIIVYLWESSINGFLSNDEDFTTADLSIGDHIIYFQVKDNDGAWSSDSQWELWIYTVPVAIAGQNSTGTPGVPLQFSGAATDEDGTVVLYEWDFDGDGVFEWSSNGNGLNTYIYNNEGTYTATLRVTDNDGFTATDTVTVIISEKTIQLDDDGNVLVEDAGEDDEGIPSVSLITSLISIGLLAIFRRK